METPSSQPATQPQNIQCQCRHCRRGGPGIITRFFRFIGLIVILALVFVAGLAIGGVGSAGIWPMGRGLVWDSDDAPRTVLKGSAGGFNVTFGSGERLFGVVTAIAGQNITLADNGGGTQTVTVVSDTIVLDGEREVPVWSLRVGNSVRVFGPSKDAVITAHLIEVIR